MRKLALAIAAILVLAVVAPAFSQPFADVPTDHWAFDAIAELAAKGIVEGYPDGTFKGDRAMTRYEMAMVVARILARIEAIKIPPPPPPVKIPAPEVGRADITAIQRLVNEFRAELAALGVRVTAVEEELAALKAKTDNTTITGFFFFRHQSPLTGNGAPYDFALFNLTFNGKISRTASATVNLLLSDSCGGGVFAFGGGTSATCGGVANVDSGGYPIQGVTFDRAYIDASAYGLNWRLGRQSYRLGPVGLLFNEGSVAVNGGNSVGIDGLKVTGAFGPISWEAAGFTYVANAAVITAQQSALMARASMALVPGWTFGVNFYTERHNQTSPTPFISNTGYSVDASGTVVPGLTLAAEYVSFTPSGAASQTAYQVNATLNLAQLAGLTQYSPSLRFQYKNYPTGYSPVYRGGNDMFGLAFTADYNAWNVRLSMTVSPQFRPYVNYESGTTISTGAANTELEIGFFSQVTTGLTAQFRYQLRTTAGATATNRYRLQLDASW